MPYQTSLSAQAGRSKNAGDAQRPELRDATPIPVV